MVFVDVENELKVFMQIELLVILDLVITVCRKIDKKVKIIPVLFRD